MREVPRGLSSGQAVAAAQSPRRVVISDDATLAIGLLCYLTLLQVAYFALRHDERWLYFASYFPFHAGHAAFAALVSYFIVGPIAFIMCKRAEADLFALLLLPLVIIGGTSGAVILAYSQEYGLLALFLLYFLVTPAFLAVLRLPMLEYPRVRLGARGDEVFLLVGALSAGLYIFWAVKYRSLLGFPGILEVYDYRSALSEALAPWERYAMIMAKFVGGFSLAYVAIVRHSAIYIFPAAIIFVLDYMLGGHKASFAFLLVILAAYAWFRGVGAKFKVHHAVWALCLAPVVIMLNAVSGLNSRVVISLYDRVFGVTAGLFARYYNHANEHGLYYGGDGLLGGLLGGVRENYREAIGRIFFAEGVSANADLVSDAYINFGFFGPLVALLVLRLIVSRRDAAFYCRNREAAAVFVVPYALALFSMGLQTALVTGALAFGLILTKMADIKLADDGLRLYGPREKKIGHPAA